ncbi:MAG: DUF6298 domain-containing protein [Planctomycetota bacterium]|nr:DUF6298 domain-containing protein [Planctomycetota bacterium]
MRVATMATVLLVPVALVWAAGAAAAQGAPAAGPLRVHPANPRYFTDGTGRAVLLVGSHTWPSLVDMGTTDPPPPFDFAGYLDFLAEHGHNFIRLWTWEPVTWNTRGNREQRVHHCAPQPYARTGPGKALDGKPRFDLTKYDPSYFDRLRRRVEAAGRRGIYVSVMLFEGWAMQHSPGAWEGHPFHPKNNASGIDGDANGDGKGLEVHELVDPKVTAVQEAYVRKVIDTVGDLDNVLYEISNENHPPSTKWQYHMIDFIHRYEKKRPKQHPVGMTFQYKGGRNRDLFEGPADWVSPNPSTDVPKGYNYRDNPPPADGRKVVLTDTDHLWGIGGDYRWVWKSFLRGLNPIFMDPYDGKVLGLRHPENWPALRRAMGDVLRLSRRMGLAAMTPRGNLASTGYCLARAAKKNAEYLVYLPKGGKATVDLSAAEGPLVAEWFDPKTGKTVRSDTATGGARREFAAPFDGDAVLYLSLNGRR